MTPIKPFIFRNIFLRIKKVLTVFLIFEKIFLKIDGLICDFKTYINWTQYINSILTNQITQNSI